MACDCIGEAKMKRCGVILMGLVAGVASAGTIVVKTEPVWQHKAEFPKEGVAVAQENVKDSCAFAAEARVEACYRGLVLAFRKGAHKAKLVYLTMTPLLKQMPAGQKPDGFNPGDAVVQRLNRIATKVMQEEGVEVLDLYTVMSERLDYANGGNDIYHWTKDKGYPLIAESITTKMFGK